MAVAMPRPRRHSGAPSRDLDLLDLAGNPLAEDYPGAVTLGFRACDSADAMLPGRCYLNDAGALHRFEAGENWQLLVRLEAVVYVE